MTLVSPFRISLEDEELLERSDAFAAVREHLRRQELGMDAPRYVESGLARYWNCPNIAKQFLLSPSRFLLTP